MSQLPDRHVGHLTVGDRVRIGKGRRTWIVAGFFTSPTGALLVDLEQASNPHVNTSATPDRLTPVRPCNCQDAPLCRHGRT